MKGRDFEGKHSEVIADFLQEFKAACDAHNIHDEVVMSLFNHYSSDLFGSVMRARVSLPGYTPEEQQWSP